MKTFIQNFLRDESGASAAEYALIIAVVGVGIGAAALLLGSNIKTAIDNASADVFNCSDAGAVTASGSPSTGTECDAAAAE